MSRPKCIKCHRYTLNRERTLCAVHMAEVIYDAQEERRKKAQELGLHPAARIRRWLPDNDGGEKP